jgi:hypothetical protein
LEYVKEETVWMVGVRRILKWDRRMCTGFMWLRVEVRGGLL